MAAIAKTDKLVVKNASGDAKIIAAVSGASDVNSKTDIFAANEILPVHLVSDVSGAAGNALAALSGAISPSASYVAPANVVTVTGSVTTSLSATSIDVQATAEMASGVVIDSVALTTGAQQIVKVHASSNTKVELDKSLMVIIHNASPNVAYIKLHNNNATLPSDLATATDYSYRLEAYATYEASAPNARLWHSISGSADAAGKLITTVTKI